jgi:hypothetical protein
MVSWTACAFSGDEFTRCGSNFGGKDFDGRCIIGGKDETGDTIFERDASKLFSPLRRRPAEQGSA